MILWADTETYSEVPIKRGTYVYAENCEVDIIAYAIDDEEPIVLDIANGDDLSGFLAAVEAADYIVTHNVMFDRNVLRLGNLKIDIPIEKWRCSMVRAMAHGLPGSLDKLGAILGIAADKRKLKEGRDLMMLFCKPRPKNSKLRRATKATHPEEWARYLNYADHDVEAMRAICAKLPRWNYAFEPDDSPGGRELALWHLDQRINDRGFAVDTDLVHASLRAVDKEQARLKAKTQADTNYDPETGEGLGSATQRDAMLAFILEQYGMLLPDLRGATVERVLEKDDLDPGLRELLLTRLQVSSTSTSKYKALANGVNADGRMRGTIQFDGASRTRRAAGRTFQPQNLPSRGLLSQAAIDLGVECLLAETEDLIFDNVMLLTTSTIRSTIIAPPGKKLVVADLSNIEGRDLVWLSQEDWKLQAFREFDTVLGKDGTWITGDEYREMCLLREYPALELDEKGEPVRKGHDLYKMSYAKSFGLEPGEVTKFGRSIGKVMELSSGYQGSLGAFMTFAIAYGIDLDDMALKAWDTLSGEAKDEARGLLEWYHAKGLSTYGLATNTAIVIFAFVLGWRAGHPKTKAMWKTLEEGFRDATSQPGKTIQVGRFKFRRDGAWLRLVLPSGRALCYPFPRVDDDGKCSFMGTNQFTRKWERVYTYGGKLTENCIAEGVRVLTDAGWRPIQTVTAQHSVWDGDAWVSTSGRVRKGSQVVSKVFGVGMTADHLVLTTKGWVNASSCEGHRRAPCHIPDRYGTGREYPGLPAGPWMAGGATVSAVYDLLNCGPQNRFVVLGSDGPVIVHNCAQSFARDILFDSMPAAEAAGYAIDLHVHDELVTETPDTPEYGPAHLSAIIATPPSYAPDIPLAAAGFESYRYRKD